MPHHRVTSFFRSSNESINNIKASVQRRRSPSSRSPATTPREGTTRTISYASSIEDNQHHNHSTTTSAATSAATTPAAEDHTHSGFHANFWAPTPVNKMTESTTAHHSKEKDHKDHPHHRLSLPGLHFGASKHSKEHGQHPNASLDWKIESPPVVLHGDAENSTGALVSGQLLLAVKEVPFEVESFEARLHIHVIQKRPYQHHCPECINQKTELKNWKFLADPAALDQRLHEFPFSVLLEGHLPASTDNPVVTVKYEFTAEVKPKHGPSLKLAKTIDVKRALPVPELPHHSVRIFPPTNIAASVHYPQVIHPIGSNKLQLRLEGIVKTNTDVNTVEYWKLKRLSWKLEEHLNTVAPACAKHSPSAKNPDAAAAAAEDAASKKGIKRSESRTIGSADLSTGWKSDYSPNGSVEMEVEYQCNTHSKSVCDMKSHDGTEVTHQLVVEMVVVQEYAPIHQPKHVTPTGVARILRMHFGTTLTERAGLGVSWDNEAPPIYKDVPASPPSYDPPSYFYTIGEEGPIDDPGLNYETLDGFSDSEAARTARSSLEAASGRQSAASSSLRHALQ
ncbi:arrestin n-terminal domain containing protein [Apiospora hydei]|uniref:Arrestin n-terminal domain containing protein n=1 Tax=Apiospora hydei TaxID=1337664 RepID=A0ABR1UTG0_9PEZI